MTKAFLSTDSSDFSEVVQPLKSLEPVDDFLFLSITG